MAIAAAPGSVARDAARIEAVLLELALSFAVELGYCTVPADGDRSADDGIARALLEPVSMGAVFADLCRLLEIEPPAIVRQVIGLPTAT